MTGPSKALARLGVGAVSVATVASGLIALAPSAMAAVPTLTITPAEQQGAAGTCLVFTVTSKDANNAAISGQTVTVTATPDAYGADAGNQPTPLPGAVTPTTAANQDVDFCTAGGASTPTVTTNGGAGSPDTATYTTDANGQIMVGVVSNKPYSGAQLQAFIDANNNGTREAGEETSGTAQADWTAGGPAGSNAAADSVQNVTISPTTDTAVPGETRKYTVTLDNGTNGNSDPVPGVTPNVQLEHPAGTVVAGPTACTQSDNAGQSICSITVPSNSAPGNNYIVTAYVNQTCGAGPQLDGCEPSDFANLTVQAAPSGDTISAACSSAAPGTSSGSNCTVDTRQGTITFTATVKDSTGAAAADGTLVGWSFSGLTPSSTTPSSGECSTVGGTCTVTASIAQADRVSGATITGTATIRGTTTSATSTATYSNAATDARNIAISPTDQTSPPGSVATVSALVTDANGKPVAGVSVRFDETGPGRFASGGGTSVTATTGADGKASVDLSTVTSESGDEVVTATITTAGTQCAQAAGAGTAPNGAAVPTTQSAGNCTSGNATIHWKTAPPPPPSTHRVAVHVHLACFSHHKHRVTCVAQLNKAISGVTVVFWTGHGKRVGIDVTNRAGKAKIHLHGLKSGSHHRYQAHARHSKRTFAATSRFAKVIVK